MALIKCKMCGGDLNISEGLTVAECEYCGSRQTIPSADNEKKMTLFNRAARLLRGCEFDKAAGIFESIVADFPEEAEAYWGLVLCRFGIEYVDDPATGKKVPTCHRSSFESVLDDPNFEQACEYNDAVARRLYREEARQIEELRKRIIEVSGKEEPYDIFISYKELDENGQRTLDSVIAQDIYKELSNSGYRVFFSRISLEDKLGVEYEPYIFAALNSAKVMIVVGTDYEHFDAVWVKNEWGRFLKLIEAGQKKVLIPVYRNMDAYDMPKELSKLAAQDMGKLGAMQDLLRGVEKIWGGKKALVAPTAPVYNAAEALVMRGQFSLDDGDFGKADEFFERALDIDPQNGEAYVGKLLVSLKLQRLEQIYDHVVNLDTAKEFARALSFSSPERQQELLHIQENVKKNVEIRRLCSLLKKRKLKLEKEEYLTKLKQEEEEKQLKLVQDVISTRQKVAPAQGSIMTKTSNTMALSVDGTVLAAGVNRWGQCNISEWDEIVAICTAPYHSLGLKANGTVVAAGSRELGHFDVEEWRNITAISAGDHHNVGLREDGTVVATGDNESGQCNVSDWTDIVAVSALADYTLGLKSDGTVLATGNGYYGRCNVSDWTDIIAISAGKTHSAGLRADGTVVATGSNLEGQCNVSGWVGIVAVFCGWDNTMGLRSDGTVVAAGGNHFGKSNVRNWTDIVSLALGINHTVGLKADGSLIATGENENGKCNVYEWRLFNSIDTVERERAEAKEVAIRRKQAEEEAMRCEMERQRKIEVVRLEAIKKQKEVRRSVLNAQKLAIEKELPTLNGLFSGKRRKELQAKLAEIEIELKSLQ